MRGITQGRSTGLAFALLSAVAVMAPASVDAGVRRPASADRTTSSVPSGPSISARGNLLRARAYDDGRLRFDPPGPRDRQRMGARRARTLATNGFEEETIRSAPEVFFALFSSSSPARRTKEGNDVPVFDRRPVWVVRFPAVDGQRQTGVVASRARRSSTTGDLAVTTEVLVIIDDRTQEEVLRSEYLPLAEASSATGTRRTTVAEGQRGRVR